MRDCLGREIMIGDLVKVYHFTGARKKKHFMYKYVQGIEYLGKEQTPYFRMIHLDPNEKSGFVMRIQPVNHPDWEIIQGYGPDGGKDYEDRQKHPVETTPSNGGE